MAKRSRKPLTQAQLDRIHQRRKLTWLIRGTKHQPPRPIRAEPSEEAAAQAVEEAVSAQFNEARDKTRLKLDLRPAFRALGKELGKQVSGAIAGLAPKKRPDGAPTGGSLAGEVTKSVNLAVRRWGYALKAGSEAGFRFAVLGLKAVDKQIQAVAVRRLRVETSPRKMQKQLAELRARVQDLKRAAEESRQEASRG